MASPPYKLKPNRRFSFQRLVSGTSEAQTKVEYEKLWDEAASIKRIRPSGGVTTTSAIAAIRQCLDSCLKSHCNERVDCNKKILEMPVEEQITLIDVRRLKLFKGLISHQYVALSYVWGSVPHFCTTKSHMEALSALNGLDLAWDRLPRIIQDAINLTDALGERYLWVDALCIAQDDEKTKHHQLDLMAQIYNCAIVTLIACSGKDSSSRLVSESAAKASVETHPSHERDPISSVHKYLPLNEQRRICENIMQSSHYSRGWTYQERLFSRRSLYFLPDRIIFHCGEGSIRCITNPYEPRMTREEFILKQGGYQFCDGCQGTCSACKKQKEIEIEWNRMESSGIPSVSEHNLLPRIRWSIDQQSPNWQQGFHSWADIVEGYSETVFKYDEDVLQGFAGISYAFESFFSWNVYQALPMSFIDIALLWVPGGEITQRITNASDRIFQSWSWLAWKGSIHFDLVRDGRTLRDFKSMLQSTLENVGVQNDRNRITKIDHGHRSTGKPLKVTSEDVQFQNESLSTPKVISVLYLEFNTHFIPIRRFHFPAVENDDAIRFHYPTKTWLKDQSSMICAVLYGISATEFDNRLSNLGEHSFICLSETRGSSYPVVNQAFAPYIFKRMFEDLGVSGVQFPSFNPSQELVEAAGPHGNSSVVPMGTIINFMLVKPVKERIYKRVAIGQMVASAWHAQSPRPLHVRLC